MTYTVSDNIIWLKIIFYKQLEKFYDKVYTITRLSFTFCTRLVKELLLYILNSMVFNIY